MSTYRIALSRRARRLLGKLVTAFRPKRPASTFTMRELLEVLKDTRDRAAQVPPHLGRLVSLVSGDLAVAVREPERRGGPDTVRSLRDWRARYNHLDRYLPRG